MSKSREQSGLHLIARLRFLRGAGEAQETFALERESEENGTALRQTFARPEPAGGQDAGPPHPHGDRKIDVRAAEVRRERGGIALAVGEIREIAPDFDVGRGRRHRQLLLLVSEKYRHVPRSEGLAQPIGRHAQQGLPVRVREEGLRDASHGRQVLALRLDEPETPPRESRQMPDQQPGEEENDERDDVARILDRERVDGGDEEEVEPQGREDGGERSGTALPDPGGQEDGEQQQESHGRIREGREQPQDADRRENEEDRGGIPHPSDAQGLEHNGILVAGSLQPSKRGAARDLLCHPPAWRRMASPESSGS